MSTAEEYSARCKVESKPVNKKVSLLDSQPALDYEHAAYRIETDQTTFWIDCPSCFDDPFDKNFTAGGIEAFHVDDHTPGFTCCLFEETLSLGDYVFLYGQGMKLNPSGPADDRTFAGIKHICDLLADRQLTTVCGYNYVIDYPEWQRRIETVADLGGF